jgi:hypothetical protein
MSERMPALFAAQAVAMSARTDGLTQHAVDDMRTRAEELLERDDPLRAAMLRFATVYELLHRDAHAMHLLGEELQAAVEVALSLTRPSLPYRSDIDG